MLNLTINGRSCQAPEGVTILEAARRNGIHIPSLCYLKDVHQYGTCRVCVVEVEGMKNLQASCMVKARDGMVIHTNSPRVRAKRKMLYELLISNHPKDCLSCSRNQSCELQALGEELGVTQCRLEGEMGPARVDVSPSITRDTSKCILCRRCVTMCNQVQGVGAINAQERGFDTVISPAMGLPLNSTACAMCGQCVNVCPTGALQQEEDGRITMRVQLCVACKMCIAVCPYGTISLDTIGMPEEGGETMAQRSRREVAVRCDMCKAWREENGKKITACMEACPVHALSMVEPDGTIIEAPKPEKKKPAAE